jgi:redox-sensitive bicupin YhaK (pirin superfamily)
MRELRQIIDAHATNDGDGVKIQRIAGRNSNVQLDPFLLLDEIKSDEASDYIGGFPEHPHRGFETITYMKTGRMRHRDHMGNEGVIESGDVQWMTAGKGVLHSEMPEQGSGLLHGFQFWLNLPADEKLIAPAYRDIRSEDIPERALSGGGRVRVIAGDITIEGDTLSGSLPPRTTNPVLVDMELQANETVELSFDAKASTLVYLYKGSSTVINQQQLGVYSTGDTLQLEAGASGANALIFGGQALREPIAQYGPFVMNTREQIDAAIDDYRHGRLV